MFAVLDAMVGVAYHLVSVLTALLTPIAGGAAAALAIIVFTVAARLVLLPFSRRQALATRTRLALAPRIASIRTRHRADPLRAHREVTALFRAEGTSMFAGLGATLIQLPVFAVAYRLFLSPTIGGHANLLFAHTLFGVPLGHRWIMSAGAFGPHSLVFIAIAMILALLTWWALRLAPAKPKGVLGSVTRVLPFGIVVAAACMPLAAGLYLVTTTAWTTAERAVLQRGPVTA
jgi:YidC/Oxa1 family membrane protein insertase